MNQEDLKRHIYEGFAEMYIEFERKYDKEMTEYLKKYGDQAYIELIDTLSRLI